MFTGIVEELGDVVAITPLAGAARISIRGPRVTSDAAAGDSISVNGTCLTVTGLDGPVFTADVMAETLSRTGLGALAPGARVNLERSVRLSDRLGGHLVQGHVDGVGTIAARRPCHSDCTPATGLPPDGDSPGLHWEAVRIWLPDGLGRYLVEKGSITVDGISLTVSALGADGGRHWFEVSLIPATLAATTLGSAAVGSSVNLEVDVIGKYVERMLSAAARPAVRS